jgi:hypothetical protein
VTGAIFAAGLSLNPWFLPHYGSPATALFYVMLIQSMRHMLQARISGEPAGRLAGVLIPGACLLLVALRAAAHPLGITVTGTPMMWYGNPPAGLARAAMQARLEAAPGRHVVVVRYSPGHDSTDEWVYNAADIDGSKVVWARDMGRQNDTLIRYYPDRTVWLLEPDADPPRLAPYPMDSVPLVSGSNRQ